MKRTSLSLALGLLMVVPACGWRRRCCNRAVPVQTCTRSVPCCQESSAQRPVNLEAQRAIKPHTVQRKSGPIQPDVTYTAEELDGEDDKEELK